MPRPATRTVRSACGRAEARRGCGRAGARGPPLRPASMRPCRSSPIRSAGVAATARTQARPGMVEVKNAIRLAQDLEHVEIAIGIEGIAGVVAGDGGRHARRLQLVQRRDAAPARRQAWAAVLEIEVAHRQADDRQPRLRDLGDDAAGILLRGEGKRAAMPAQNLAGKAIADDRVGDALEVRACGAPDFVDMEVEVEPLARQRLRRWRRGRGRSPRPAASRDRSRRPAHRRSGRRSRTTARKSASSRLTRSIGKRAVACSAMRSRQASRISAKTARRCPSARRASRDGCGSRRCHGRRRSGGRNPSGRARPRRSSARRGRGRRRRGPQRRCRPDSAFAARMALVEMGVDVDEAGQDDAAVAIEGGQLRVEARRAGQDDGATSRPRSRCRPRRNPPGRRRGRRSSRAPGARGRS